MNGRLLIAIACLAGASFLVTREASSQPANSGLAPPAVSEAAPSQKYRVMDEHCATQFVARCVGAITQVEKAVTTGATENRHPERYRACLGGDGNTCITQTAGGNSTITFTDPLKQRWEQCNHMVLAWSVQAFRDESAFTSHFRGLTMLDAKGETIPLKHPKQCWREFPAEKAWTDASKTLTAAMTEIENTQMRQAVLQETINKSQKTMNEALVLQGEILKTLRMMLEAISKAPRSTQ